MKLGTTYLLLLALLGLTVGLAFVPLGILAKPMALAIAFTKAGLVMLIFMELRESKPLTRIFAVFGILFVAILFTITFADYLGRGLSGVLGK